MNEKQLAERLRDIERRILLHHKVGLIGDDIEAIANELDPPKPRDIEPLQKEVRSCHVCGSYDLDEGTLTVGTGMFQTVERKGDGVSDNVSSAPVITEWRVVACRECGAMRRISNEG